MVTQGALAICLTSERAAISSLRRYEFPRLVFDLMKFSYAITIGSVLFLAWLSASFLTEQPIDSRMMDKPAISSQKTIPAQKLVPAQKREVAAGEEATIPARP